jgi:hypothetical protein
MRALLPFLLIVPLAAETLVVKTQAELKTALGTLKSGDTLKIGPGEYSGGHSLSGLADLTVEALDPKSPPLFRGGTNAWQFSRCPGLTLRHLHCQGQTGNGFNLDDGGQRTAPVKGAVLEDLRIDDIGPQGNFDAIKCSGLQQLRIERCEISGWGGQAIDFVGCSDALIRGCRITGKKGFSQHTGPQFKGGSSKIVIENCVFKDAGERPIQVGGSTGLDYFRPPGATYEAKDIVIRNNTLEGGTCACAFTGVDGAEFTGNTILRPTKWIFRILQETREPGFTPCRNVRVADNTITFRRAQVSTELNIGEGTAPETFRFEGNRWLAEDQPQASRPKLPVAETNGHYGEPTR